MKKRKLLEFLNRIGPISAENVAFNFDVSDSCARSAFHRLLKQFLVQRLGKEWMLTARGLERLN
jgi:predicted ArsR family transcriptional regulator